MRIKIGQSMLLCTKANLLLVDHPKVWRESSPQGLSPI
jgi:uncharacterized Zn-finger protein